MATGAGLAEWKQTHGKKKAKYVLTSTGLLMEGLSREAESHLARLLAFRRWDKLHRQ
jgi:transketolase